MGWLDCGLGALLFCTGYAFLPSFSYFQLLFSTVWVFVLNKLVPLKANELEMLSVHSLSGSSPP